MWCTRPPVVAVPCDFWYRLPLLNCDLDIGHGEMNLRPIHHARLGRIVAKYGVMHGQTERHFPTDGIEKNLPFRINDTLTLVTPGVITYTL